ncbi:MAG: RnfABCDGE type electron transport complex subunit D [Peptostreptococcaceae bacterium]|nr:RnfABCDGE type electron transport complex subunit D [Peptostreptococcaceae bacterium]
MMTNVLTALCPLVIASIFFYGWRTIAVQLVVLAFAFLAEYLFTKAENKPVTESVFVTAILYTLTLPPSIPYWIAVVGILFGVVFGKMAFGGFGRNVFNPALVGRAFAYVCFPNFMTIHWTQAASSFPGGFVKWINPAVEAITTATPLIQYRSENALSELSHLLIGNINGVMGETSKVLILLGAAYLIYKKTAAWEIMVACVVGFFGASFVIGAVSSAQLISPIHGVLSGGFLFGAVFMATDPVSAASTKEGKWIYGIIIGIVTFIIRSFSLFAEGMMFAILIANTFVPLVDETVRSHNDKKKKKGAVTNG